MSPPRALPIDHGGPADRPFEPFPYAALERPIIERFDQIAVRYGDRVAVGDGEGRLTYAQLARCIDAIAAELHTAAPERPGPVAIMLPTDLRLPGAMLGALAAGRPFAPLDLEHPIDRNLAIMRQAGVAAVVTDAPRAGELRERLSGQIPVVEIDLACQAGAPRPIVQASADDPACILYTSGSTGRPKGVCHSHRNCLHAALVIANNVHLTCEDSIGLFDAGVIGATRRTFAALLNGASLHVLPPLQLGAAGMVREIRARRLTILHAVPIIFRRIAAAAADERMGSIRSVRLTGDRSDWRDYDAFRRCCPEEAFFGVNLGSTEVCSTYAHWWVDEAVREPGSRMPVGREMDDMTVSILDPDGQPVADGEVGEFVVASSYLALGYWREPELTAEAFRPHPDDPKKRVFKTGDMGLRRADGLLEFVGRRDQMIKLRGHRVEPAETESALRGCVGVADAAIVIRRNEAGIARAMVAYVELAPEGRGLLPRHLMAMLSRSLPKHLLPAMILILDKLPRLKSFKLDRTGLQRLDAGRAEMDTSRAADRVLDQTAKAFEAVLQTSRATPEDNLLSLGGDSLQAVTVALELERRFALKVPAEVMARSLSIRELADWISARLGERASSPAG